MRTDADDPFAHVAGMLDRLRDGGRERRILRLGVVGPTIAFSRRDERAAGYARAVEVAKQAGFGAAVRPVGGTFAPLHEGSLVVDEFGWTARGEWPNERFDRHAHLLAAVYRGFGIDARVGEVPGEYCPGAHSVNRAGDVKLSGTAQRVARGAWLVSSVVQVGPIEPLLDVTAAVAAMLGAHVDVRTIGALSETVPGLTVPGVAARIADAFRRDGVTDIDSHVEPPRTA